MNSNYNPNEISPCTTTGCIGKTSIEGKIVEPHAHFCQYVDEDENEIYDQSKQN